MHTPTLTLKDLLMKRKKAGLLIRAALLFPTLSGFPVIASAASPSATQAHAALQAQMETLAKRALPGTFGIAVLDLQSGDTWHVNADKAYPMMSVFKAPVAAAVLSRVEHGQNTLDQTLTLTRADLDYGPIRDQFKGEQMTFTVRQLLAAAVSKSDNSAVDALIRLIGGPSVVTAYLREHGIVGMSVDRDEAGMGRLFEDLGPNDSLPANETDAEQDQRYKRGYARFMADPGNRSTPNAASTFLQKLWRSELLSPASSKYLLDLMYAQTLTHRLRGGLPPGVRLADKSGTSGEIDGLSAAYNDIGIMVWPDGHAVIVAAFMSGSNAPPKQRDAMFAQLARDVGTATHP
jgi:beta-lactamase class A